MTEPFQHKSQISQAVRIPPWRSASVFAGTFLIIIAAVALWAMSDLSGGTMRAIGPAAMPRAIAIGMAVLGAITLLSGLRHRDDAIEAFPVRGIVVVMIAIVLFAVTIRPMQFGSFATPGLGLIGAGPLAVLVAGLAQRERNWPDLCILALVLTAFCMLLFGYLLNLPIPAFPVSLLALFPGWQQSQVLLVLSLVLLAGAILIVVARRTLKPAGLGDAR